MDRRLIAEKLESLRSCVRRIDMKSPESSQVLQADLNLQDIIQLEIAGQNIDYSNPQLGFY